MEYRHVGTHVEDLHDGRSLGHGEFVELSKNELREERIEQLVADGILIPVESKAEGEAKLAERRVTGRQQREEQKEQERAEGATR